MRTPTPAEELYRWHTAAMHGLMPPVHDGEPQCGWYLTHLVKQGVWVPARIWCVQRINEAGELTEDEFLQGEIDGAFCPPEDMWLRVCESPVSYQAFQYYTARREYAEIYEPEDPYATPAQPIDKLKIPFLF